MQAVSSVRDCQQGLARLLVLQHLHGCGASVLVRHWEHLYFRLGGRLLLFVSGTQARLGRQRVVSEGAVCASSLANKPIRRRAAMHKTQRTAILRLCGPALAELFFCVFMTGTDSARGAHGEEL